MLSVSALGWIHSASKIWAIWAQTCQPLSAAAILQIHSSPWQRGPAHPLWATWELTCSSGSTHRQPSSFSRGPAAPALSHYVGEMFGGLSVPSCRSVSKHNASQWALKLSQHTVCFCGCGSVSMWMISSFLRTLFPSFPTGFFSYELKTKQGKGSERCLCEYMTQMSHISSIGQCR